MTEKINIVRETIIAQLKKSVAQADWIILNVKSFKSVLVNELSEAKLLADILKYIESRQITEDKYNNDD